jgi:hypothetical protein
MPVIINDFEVVVEPQDQGASRGGRESEPSQGMEPSLRPEDIEQIIRHYRDRYLRLLAD